LPVEMKLTYCVFNKETEAFLGLKVSRADTGLTRLLGLARRPSLRSDEGIWLVPSRGVHTIGALTPIDLVYLDETNRVIHLIEHLNPFRIAPAPLKSFSVLGLPAHTIYASHTRPGDQLLICPPEEMNQHLNEIAAAKADNADNSGKEHRSVDETFSIRGRL
jgi:uncharacterized membrane protein (UPF0127 family)